MLHEFERTQSARSIQTHIITNIHTKLQLSNSKITHKCDMRYFPFSKFNFFRQIDIFHDFNNQPINLNGRICYTMIKYEQFYQILHNDTTDRVPLEYIKNWAFVSIHESNFSFVLSIGLWPPENRIKPIF